MTTIGRRVICLTQGHLWDTFTYHASPGYQRCRRCKAVRELRRVK